MDEEYYHRLAQLEERIDRIEAMMQALCVHLGMNPSALEAQGRSDPPGVEAIREALLSGNKIHAIKIYRSIYGVGLKQAKEAVDAMERNLRR